jgi:hypothetical protein
MQKLTSAKSRPERRRGVLSVLKVAIGLVSMVLFSTTTWAVRYTCSTSACTGTSGRVITYFCPSLQDSGQWACCADDPCVRSVYGHCTFDGWECSWQDICSGHREVEAYYCPS